MTDIKIIAEIGINHNGEAEEALRLIKAASGSGVWGIKFQYRNLENAYADDANQIGDEMLIQEIRRNFLSPETILSLTQTAKKLGLKVGISFFDVADIDDFRGDILAFDFFKTPSVELLNATLNNTLLSFEKPLYLSLGCHAEEEIDRAFSLLKQDNWTALHCVSNYPVSLANARLGYLNHMRDKWQRPYGYSSHDGNWETCLIAMSMGVTVIERHITFDKDAKGLDHTTSSTPDEFKKMAIFAENIRLLMAGNTDRVPNQGEMLNLQNLGRSYYAKKSFNKGEEIQIQDLSLHSPRVGLSSTELPEYLGTPIVKDVAMGEVVTKSAFISAEHVSERAIAFAKENNIAIPVRLHDLEGFENKFPIGAYEFHLSFKEVLSGLNVDNYGASNRYSIHLPDYISPTALMDPFSDDDNQVEGSLKILEKTVAFAKALQDKTGVQVPIVGSFSVVHKSVGEFYEQHATLLSTYNEQGISILPQWLPPIAWYFGGSVKLDVMNELKDVAYINQHALPICMDICHLCMGDSLHDFNASGVVDSLANHIQHIHIADAAGIDGEGLSFGEGDTKNMAALKKAFDFDCLKVIEVWQGHLDNGAGFSKALNDLETLFK